MADNLKFSEMPEAQVEGGEKIPGLKDGKNVLFSIEDLKGTKVEVTSVDGGVKITVTQPDGTVDEKTVTNGTNGTSSVVTVEQTDTGATITTKDGDGNTTSSAEVKNGADGGTPTIEAEETDEGVTVTTKNAAGETVSSVTLKNGKDGNDAEGIYEKAAAAGYTGTADEFAAALVALVNTD